MVVQAQDMCLMRRRKRKQAKKEEDIIKRERAEREHYLSCLLFNKSLISGNIRTAISKLHNDL